MFQKNQMIIMTKHNSLHIVFAKVFLILVLVLIPVSTAFAASIKVRYDGKTINFTKQQAQVKLDDKSIDMGGMPGLVLDDSSMVPYDTVFKTGLGAACSYNSSEGTLTIKKNGIVIQMTVGKKTAYVDGKKVTMPIAPKKVKYYDTGKTKILIPAQFVATKLAYQYSWINNSKTSLTIVMTSPFRVYYDLAWHNYNSTFGKVSVDNQSVNVSNMQSIVVDNTAMVQAKAVFSNSSIGAEYVYDKTAKTVTLIKGDNSIYMTLGSKTAIVNGQEKTMDSAARIIKNGSTGKSYIMVPGRFVSNNLGYDYNWNGNSKTSEITTPVPEKESSVYFNFPQVEGSTTADLNYNYITNIVSGYDEVEKKDYITFTTSNVITPSITTSNSNVIVDFPTTINNVGEQVQALTNSSYLRFATVSTTADQHVLVTLERNEGVSYEISENETQTTLTFGTNERIKIAVDCGHGSYTAGKRTPKMPVDIDFEGDGTIDIYAGETIKEHTANVGVGIYLAAELERCGFDVYRSAFGDTDIPLSERQANINEADCDYSISIHFNAVGDGKTFNDIAGMELFYHRSPEDAGDGKSMAKALLKELIQGTEQDDRGVKSASLAMCNSTATGTLASVLVECAFMTNEDEAINMMGNASYWKETAIELAKGMCNYTGVSYIPE